MPAHYLSSVGHTLALAGLTALIALGLGLALGVLLGKTDLPLRGAFAVLLADTAVHAAVHPGGELV